jgi:hypothetical protein
VTHLVVEPDHDRSLARLVSAELHARVTIRVEQSRFARRPSRYGAFRAWRVAYLRPDHFPLDDSDCDVGVQEVFALPYYSANDLEPVPLDTSVVYDRTPKSKIEIRRASAV